MDSYCTCWLVWMYWNKIMHWVKTFFCITARCKKWVAEYDWPNARGDRSRTRTVFTTKSKYNTTLCKKIFHYYTWAILLHFLFVCSELFYLMFAQDYKIIRKLFGITFEICRVIVTNLLKCHLDKRYFKWLLGHLEWDLQKMVSFYFSLKTLLPSNI